MSALLQSNYLEYKPDLVVTLRKSYGLHEPGRMDEAIDLLQDWIKKQPHFLVKEYALKAVSCKSNMAALLQSSYLEYKPDTIFALRKSYGLHQAGRMDQAIDILEDWINKQSHFTRKDYEREVLEIILITCKGMVERAKAQIDKLCTLKTILSHQFTRYDVSEFNDLFDKLLIMMFPKMLNNYQRVCLVKATGQTIDGKVIKDYFGIAPLLGEYLKRFDYIDGLVVILDYRKLDVLSFATKTSLSDIRNFFAVTMGGYGLRMKGIHVISESQAVDLYVSLMKQVLSAKVGSRVTVSKTPEELFHIVPKDLWPSDYGGKEKSAEEMTGKFREELSSKTVMEYVKKSFTYCTDESKREAGKFNEEYLGMPGSFRNLTVD